MMMVCFPGGSVVKNLPANAGDAGLIPGSRRSPGEGNGDPLQYSWLENSMDRRAWWATVHRVAKSRTQLSTAHAMIMQKISDSRGTKESVVVAYVEYKSVMQLFTVQEKIKQIPAKKTEKLLFNFFFILLHIIQSYQKVIEFFLFPRLFWVLHLLPYYLCQFPYFSYSKEHQHPLLFNSLLLANTYLYTTFDSTYCQ